MMPTYISSIRVSLQIFRSIAGPLFFSRKKQNGLQLTIFFCAANFQKLHPEMPFDDFLLGTDVLERFIGNLRLLRSNNDRDSLEMINYM